MQMANDKNGDRMLKRDVACITKYGHDPRNAVGPQASEVKAAECITSLEICSSGPPGPAALLLQATPSLSSC